MLLGMPEITVVRGSKFYGTYQWIDSVSGDLRYNDFLALLFTRLHYWLKGDPIPETIEERAKYWKLHYNTSAGKGTVEHYLEMNRKFGIKID